MDFAHRRQLIGSMVGDSVGIPKLTPEYLHVCLDLWLILCCKERWEEGKSIVWVNVWH